MSLTIDQLFTPDQSGVGLDPNVPAPDGTWLAFLLSASTIVNLPTTAWQPGGPERTILAIAAVALSQEDVVVSMMAQGGFLDFAASGTVTSVAIDGTSVTRPVTPDPSIPSENPDGSLGWLDALGQSFFEVDRLLATRARGALAVANTPAGTITYGAGAYHAGNVATGFTYSNPAGFSAPTSAIAGTGGVVTAVALGSGTATFTTQSAHGITVGATVFVRGVVGITGMVDPFFAVVTATPTTTTFRIAVSASGAWTSGGTVYLCTVVQMQADALGLASNAAPNQVTQAITQNSGVFISNITSWSASNYESNKAYAERIRLSLARRSPNGPSAAYQFFALTAQAILAAESPPIALKNGAIVKAIAFDNPITEVVTTVVSSATPASTTLGQAVTPGCSQLAVTNATNASPIEITTATPHGLLSGDVETIAGVLGNTAANQTGTLTKTGASTFTIDGSTGNGAWTGGGSVEGSDLGQVDIVLQENVVPDGITAVTVSSLAFPIAVVATVVVPQAYLASYQLAAPIALQKLLATFPIGGNIPPGGSFGTIPISAIEGALIDAGVLTAGAVSFVRQVTSLTINGGTIDLPYPSELYDAQLAAPVITVVGV